MFRHRSVLSIVAALVASVACSHQQEVKQTPRVATAAPRAPIRPAVKAPLPPVAEDVTKNKEDDAIYFDFDSALLRDQDRPV